MQIEYACLSLDTIKQLIMFFSCILEKKQNINAYDDKIEEKERKNNDTEMRKECVKFL
jgi:hypothetical protein